MVTALIIVILVFLLALRIIGIVFEIKDSMPRKTDTNFSISKTENTTDQTT